MTSIVLQRTTSFSSQQGVLIGPVSGTVYTVNALGQVIVSGSDAAALMTQGWKPTVPGNGANVALVDFGAFPGASYASTTIASVCADSSAMIDCFIVPIATADHSADEHTIDAPVLSGQSDGNGNLIISAYPNTNVPYTDNMMPWGKWSVVWAYMQ